MVDAIQQYWWVFLILWIVSKISRHAETKEKKKQEHNTGDAESLVLSAMRSINKNVDDGGGNSYSPATWRMPRAGDPGWR